MMEDNTLFYDEILNQGPSQDTVRIILARFKDEGLVNEAVKWCMKFLRAYPDDVRLRMLLAECYLEMGSVGQAETEFLMVSSMIRDLTPAYARLAEIYTEQKRFSEAAEAAGMFLAYHPDDPRFRELLEKAAPAKDASEEEAPVHARPVLSDDEAESLADLATPTIAELYYGQGQLEAAVATYEKVLREHPDDSVSAERLSHIKAEMEIPISNVNRDPGDIRVKNEKMLTILEKWLPRTREITYG